MAITDHRRIKTVNSFFNPTETYTKSLMITIEGEAYEIPLSRGINVIIGDNSIGKSLLLHKLTEYRKQQDTFGELISIAADRKLFLSAVLNNTVKTIT